MAGFTPNHARRILVNGATGYLGRSLVPQLLNRGFQVRALVRPGSLNPLPDGVQVVTGNPLHNETVFRALRGCDTLVHLIGVSKPSPSKAALFRSVDLASIRAAVEAVARAKPQPHLVYLSVAHPAPVMKAYIQARQEGEAFILQNRIQATFLRPWYVLGPGHRWPYLLMPIYAILRSLPKTRASAERLGFVTLPEMTASLLAAVERPPTRSPRIIEVPGIRHGGPYA